MAEKVLDLGNKLAAESATESNGKAIQGIFSFVKNKQKSGALSFLRKKKNKAKELHFNSGPALTVSELTKLKALEKKLHLTWKKKPASKEVWEKLPDTVDVVLDALRTEQ